MLCPSCNQDRQPSIQLNPGRGAERFVKVCPCGNVLGRDEESDRKAVPVGAPGHWDKPASDNAVWVPEEPKAPKALPPDPCAEPAVPVAAPAPDAPLAPHPASPPAATLTGANFVDQARARLAQIDAALVGYEALRMEREAIARMLSAAERKPRARRSNVVSISKKAAQ